MTNGSRTGLEILLAAVGVGILGNVLLRQTPWGLNAFVFVAVFTAAMIAVTYRSRRELISIKTLSIQGAMVFFASMFLIRDSIELRIFDTIAIIVLMGVSVLPNFGVDQRVAGVFHYAAGAVWSGVCSLFAPFVLLGSDIDWKAMPGNGFSKGAFAVFRGIAIALPLFLIFGALLMAADAAFEDFANNVVSFDLENIISHVMLTSFLAWLVAGYFRASLIEQFVNVGAAAAVSVVPATEAKHPDPSAVENLATDDAADPDDASLPNHATVVEHINISDPPNADVESAGDSGPAADESANRKRDWQNFDNTKVPPVFTLDKVETIIILGVIDALFLTFVIFQLPYLFGGMDLVQNTPDLKLAEFARRGFGELVTVSFLVLPMLLASHWLLRRDAKANETIFRVLAGVQIVLLFVIMTSAMQRLVLLTGELGYGWTTVRFYPMVVMLWLAAVFIWFSWTVLRGKRQHFAWGALWLAIVTLAGTNLMNPDAFIASKNIELMKKGRNYDPYYNAQLSDDAVPAIVLGLEHMSLDDHCITRRALYWRLIEAREESAIRSLNLSRERAYGWLEPISGFLASNNACDAL
ncbi:MAG: DUF4173 domain-containing protein [Acidobacteria bacterium]|nr:DUF4173 domain-containing protein [Acidobacteriota bacterium]